MSAPSVSDILEYQALPETTRALVTRLVGCDPTQLGHVSSGDLEAAYRAGWDACADDVMAPAYHAREFRRWMESRKVAA